MLLLLLQKNLRFPVRIFIVLGQIPVKRLHIVVRKNMPQLPDTTIHDDMLMDLDITHRMILIFQSALEVPLAASKQRQLPETVPAKTKFPSKKIEPKEN